MNGEREENLKDLFEKFLNSEQAEQAVKDIEKGEQILRETAAPEPDKELIANIKAGITASLLHKKENAFSGIVYKTMAIAAGFILLAVISVKLFEKYNAVPPGKITAAATMPKAVWESERLADDGADSAILVDEVKQIESDLFAMQFDENGGNGREAATELELETELTEINADFWKG